MDTTLPPDPPPPADTQSATRVPMVGRSFFRSGLVIVAAYVLMMGLIGLATWALIRQDQADQQHIQTVELASLACAQEEHVSHVFDRVTDALNTLAELAGPDGSIPPEHLARLTDKATRTLHKAQSLRQLRLVTAPGHTLLDLSAQSAAPQPPLPPPAADYWQHHAETQFLVHPVLQDAQGNPHIVIERALRNAKGIWQGSLIALIDARDFDDYLRDIRLTPQDRFSLLSLDGSVQLHLPPEAQATPAFADVLRRATIAHSLGSVETTYAFGDAQHVGMYRLLHELPLVVVVSRPTNVARAGFVSMQQRLLAGVLALAVLLAVLCWLIYADERRHQAARLVLGRLNASLEERMTRRTAELEQSNRELLAFSYSISHDLRAPLRAINGFAYALKEDYGDKLDEQGRDYLNRVYRASVRMGELIDELLALANVSRTPLNIRMIDITALANDIVGDLRINSPGREVVFETQADMQAEGDEALLRNALSNLLHNAWKFTRTRSLAVIHLSAEEEGEQIRFTLTDNGIGFNMAHAKRLFQPFQQLHGDQGFGGTGIGLASVRRIIERHGGTIWAESSPDEGARFIFMIPRRAHVIRRRREG